MRRSILSQIRFAAAVTAAAFVALGFFLGVGVADAQSDRKKAREHFEQAEAFMNTAVYDEAVAEYRKAYKYAPKAHGFLFNIGLAYEKWGKRDEALAAYGKYLEKAPRGKKAAEAKARKVALERALAAEEDTKPDPDPLEEPNGGQPDDDDPPEDSDQPDDVAAADPVEPDSPGLPGPVSGPIDRDPGTSTSGRGVSGWAMIGVGAALIGGGVLVDLLPDSSSNGSFDALDLAPVGLYAAGATLVIVGTF